jgi:hypothetical protein
MFPARPVESNGRGLRSILLMCFGAARSHLTPAEGTLDKRSVFIDVRHSAHRDCK